MAIQGQKKNNRMLWNFALASFFNDLGAHMLFPIWPVFVTSFLGGSMVFLGFIDGIGNACVSLSKAMSGFMSDRLGKRKPFILIGYIMPALARIGYALSPSYHYLLPFKVLERSGKMRDSPRDAIVADHAEKDSKGESFAFLDAMDHLGAFFGVVLCLMLFQSLGFRKLIALASIPSLISAYMIYKFMREEKNQAKTETIKISKMSAELKMFLFTSGVAALSFFSYSFFLLYCKKFGFEAESMPLLFLVIMGTYSLSTIAFARIGDMFGRKPVLMASYLLFALTCLGFTIAHSPQHAFMLFVLYGMHLASLEPTEIALITDIAPSHIRSSLIGTLRMITGLCAFPASFLAGLLWEGFGPEAAFLYGAALSLAAFLLLSRMQEKKIREYAELKSWLRDV